MRFLRRVAHRAICAYLRQAGGAFHTYKYGVNGRYVVLMTEKQFSKYKGVE